MNFSEGNNNKNDNSNNAELNNTDENLGFMFENMRLQSNNNNENQNNIDVFLPLKNEQLYLGATAVMPTQTQSQFDMPNMTNMANMAMVNNLEMPLPFANNQQTNLTTNNDFGSFNMPMSMPTMKKQETMNNNDILPFSMLPNMPSLKSKNSNKRMTDVSMSFADLTCKSDFIKSIGLQTMPIYINKNDCIYTNTGITDIFIKLPKILKSYNNEIVISQFDKQCYEMQGYLWLNHTMISFAVACFQSNTNHNDIAIEIRRMRGDTILFHQFWSQIVQIFSKQFANVRFGFNNKLVDNNSSNNNNNNNNTNMNNNWQFNNNDINEFKSSLENGYQNEIYHALTLLCSGLESNNPCAFNNATVILNEHYDMITILVDILKTQSCQHLLRCSLVIILALCQQCQTLMEKLLQNNILEVGIPLLFHDNTLIQKHCVRLLSFLATNQNEWNFDSTQEILGKLGDAKKSLCSDYYASQDFITEAMFDKVASQLIGAC